MDIGQRIHALRIKHGFSQEALAERLGVTRQSVSKWELGQALPDIEKVVMLSRLFRVTTDSLLLGERKIFAKPNKQILHLGSTYLIVKDFMKSIGFYEKFLSMRVSTINPGRFAEFYFDNKCIALMSEANLPGHDYSGGGDHKFVLNFWINDLAQERERVKGLNLGEVSEIYHAHTNYYYFNVIDPDGNVLEITGGYGKGENEMSDANTGVTHCQSCYMPMVKPEDFGEEADGSPSADYCHYCFKNGGFTTKQTLEEAVEGNIQFWREEGETESAENDAKARARIMEVFPTLKRWKNPN